MKLTKSLKNPILRPNPKNDWENLVVLNPAVIYDEANARFVMLYRAAGDTVEHYIHLGLAYSDNGIDFVRQSDQPSLSPDYDGADGGCVEDPRLVKMGDWYYLTYAARPYAPGRYWLNAPKPWFNPPKDGPRFLSWNNSVTYLAITQDFKTYKKLGRMTDAREDDRDVYIFPEAVKGKYVRLSRPMFNCGPGWPNENPAMWIAFSDDLLEWPKPTLLMQGETWWESKKIGGSCPPLKTPYGWFVIYHGVAKKDDAYRVGAILLDLDDPTKIIARTKEPILEPEFDYETSGVYNGCVFPTGNVVKDGVLYVYYGAADKFVCVATGDFEALLQDLLKNGK
ncbi:MAG TPA: glycosidase [Acholeplasmatales bacterium]|nr:MAG: glycosidase [Tenericutes bacterium GWF2_57_13]HAQ56246.1 glycosidase [Acholeplasmatales bacterium]